MRRLPKSNRHLPCPKCHEDKSVRSELCCRCLTNKTDIIQRIIVTGLATNKTIKQIALETGRSPKTIEYHWAKAKQKYHIASYVQAVYLAIMNRWVDKFGNLCPQ